MYDVIIIGSGPAGLTAAIYSVRFGFTTLVIAGRKWGGQLMLTTDVENYPGFAKITGPELMQKMRDQVTGLGVEVLDIDFTKLTSSSSRQMPGSQLDSGSKSGMTALQSPFLITAEDKTFQAKSIIVATGADTRWLGVPGEEKLRGHGVSSCAPCDAFFFKGKAVAVIGGGDSAMEEAQVIAKVSQDVALIHRRDEFRAQKAMIDKVKAMKNIRIFLNTKVLEMQGEAKLTGLVLETAGKRWVLPREGVFVAIGLDPNTQKFSGLDLDSHGYVKRYEERTDTGHIEYFTKTNVPGIFTAGDVHDSRYKQAITAAGFGCMAAIDVEKWLSEYGNP